MGRNYEYSEWLQFECEGVEISKELAKLAEKFAKRANEVADAFLHSQLGPDKILDGQRIAAYNEDALVWNTYASIVGHGVGLWEEDGDTGLPGELEGKLDEIVKKDKKLQRLADQIQGECAGLKSDAGVEERASDFSSKDAAVRSAQSHGATHVALRPTHVFAFNPSANGYEKRELFFARGKLHWPAASVHVKALPVDAIAIEHALGRQAAETPRGEGPLQADERDYPFYIYVELEGETVFVGTARGANRTDARMDFLRKHPKFERRGKLIAVPDVPGAREDDPEGSEPLQSEERRALRVKHGGAGPWMDLDDERVPQKIRNAIHAQRAKGEIEGTVEPYPGHVPYHWESKSSGGRWGREESPQGGEPLPAEARREPAMPTQYYMFRHALSKGRAEVVAVGLDDNERVVNAIRGDTQASVKKAVKKWWPRAIDMGGGPLQSDAASRRQHSEALKLAEDSPGVGGPSPAEARESTAVPAEDAVPWVRITRDPEQYAEGMKRAKEIGPINSGKEIYELLAPALSVENQEVFLVVLCNLRQECLGVAEVHRGERSRVSVSRADILQVVTKSGADHFHVVHNHPSGDPTPSEADRKLTDAIMSGGDNVDIPCVDHVVIGMGKYYSFAKGKVVTVK